MEQAVRRHIKNETGSSRATIKKALGTKETIFKDSAHGPSTHSINTVFLVEAPYKKYDATDTEYSDFKWFSTVDKKWPSYVRGMLKAAGFK